MYLNCTGHSLDIASQLPLAERGRIGLPLDTMGLGPITRVMKKKKKKESQNENYENFYENCSNFIHSCPQLLVSLICFRYLRRR